jgi:SAM-dependent methyltransferase
MQDDGPRWDARYNAVTDVAPRAPEIIERWPDLLSLVPTAGTCLDVACGPGATTLWLAERGLDVTALDASALAVGLLVSAASDAGSLDRVDARVVDLDDGLPDDVRHVELIVCQRFRDPSLYLPMVERLGAGGVLMVTVLSAVGATDPGPFHAPPGELRSAFAAEGVEIIEHAEGDGVAHLVARRR